MPTASVLSLADVSFPAPTLQRRIHRLDSSMNLKRLGPSAVDIQHHLYNSFLEGSTADVALRVHGSWSAIYKLHRVVLIQSGFFRSLFTAGFIESSPRISSHINGPDEIVIHFDDRNITRAAFELCISRLYGGGPPLDISPFLIPSLSQPLSPSFPFESPSHTTPNDHHPATPRFLLSLLATAAYLSIPSLASQALSAILGTVGPHTVLKYLDFALGKHIGFLETEPGEPEAAVGLERVAQLIDDERSTIGTSRDTASLLGGSLISKEDPMDQRASTSSMLDGSFEDLDPAKEPTLYYGAISDKIGEACACWLARWGTDLLPYEESLDRHNDAEPDRTAPGSSKNHAEVLSPAVKSSSGRLSEAKQESLSIPLIWSRGGLSPKWVAAIISADTFFVKGERERYDFARRMVELRRRHGIIATEEEEWVKLFEHGIYYANMSMEDVVHISQDVSPTTKRPFVPLSALQAAHWSQSLLRHHITVRPTSLGITPPSPRDKELGIIQTTADILASNFCSDDVHKDQPFFPVPSDSSVRIGDNGGNFSSTVDGGSLSMDQLFASSTNLVPLPSSPTLKPNISNSPHGFPTSEADFFGLLSPRFTASSVVSSDSTGISRWSPYPPYRFAVEFWNVDSLKEKSRLHSHTIFYAGSLFNIYVQVVRKKGQVQLGIYLHRQSTIEPLPPPSAPSSVAIRHSERTESQGTGGTSPGSPRSSSHTRGPSFPSSSFPPLTQTTSHYSPSIYPSSRSTTPLSYGNASTSPSSSLTSGSSPSSHSASMMTSNTLPATTTPIAPPQPYRDPRPAISAYFTISCASATGSSQTRFTSSPDVFSVSQSWGWKSSSLRTEEYMDVRGEGASMTNDIPPSKEASLRATVILGLV
ncbi:hypothetical protein Hypma_015082 [Hypsizygus marmoreus]|uniref:BTB domain-containing protein n=1 Tax=Hypsizygus marmoreus TaxID=39966 RepID=A0A369K7F6_HYPMA|nr:hypothetical protein Hypma_015082 [Hypsizygus marmoreus]